MATKLVPAHPSQVMVIRNITSNIATLSLPFLRFGLLRIGGRATIVKLTSGALAVFSPVALTTEVQEKIRAMGNNLKYIIAPDMEHHIFVSDWAKAYPAANFIGPEGLPEKRAMASSDPSSTSAGAQVPFSTIFEAKTKLATKISAEFDADFEYEYVDAHRNKELVFFYKPEKVLLEADLMFNLPATEQYSRTGEPANQGFLTKLFGLLQNTLGPNPLQRYFLWYGPSSRDRPGFNASVKRIDVWDFDTIIPCHGDVIQGNAKSIFRTVFEWHLKDVSSG